MIALGGGKGEEVGGKRGGREGGYCCGSVICNALTRWMMMTETSDGLRSMTLRWEGEGEGLSSRRSLLLSPPVFLEEAVGGWCLYLERRGTSTPSLTLASPLTGMSMCKGGVRIT